eukprot:g7600.t1
MFKYHLAKLQLAIVVLKLLTESESVSQIEMEDNFVESWHSETDNSLRSSSGTIMRLAPMQYSSLCKDTAFAYSGGRLEYSYNATGLVQLFVVDRAAFEQKLETGDGLVSQGVILPDSYCLGRSCQASCDLRDVENWCLIYWNLDESLTPVNVTYQYQLSGGSQEMDPLVLILTLICVALVCLLFCFIIGCCIVRKRQKNRNNANNTRKRNGTRDEEMESVSTSSLNQQQQVPLLPQMIHPSQDFLCPLPPPPPPLPMMVNSGSHHSMRDAFYQGASPLPVSHLPPPPPNHLPSALSQELRTPPLSRKEKKSKKSKSRRTTRFPS